MATDPVSTRAQIKEVPERPLPNLPDDVAVEIMVRLPVKSLLRFRCVCKTWNSITSDPKFSKLHRMQPYVLFCEESTKIATINVESLLSAPTPAPPTPIVLPWEPDSSGSCQFLGSSNGLFCVDYKSDHIPANSGLILWNPSTRKFRRLPRPRRFGDRCTYAGFGYDESVDDYKLVWANSTVVPWSEERTIELDVLSLKSNTWRSHPPWNVIFFTETLRINDTICGVFSNGAIHWVVKNYKHPVLCYGTRILALDLATENFRFVSLPYSPLLTYHPDLGSLKGCLCLSAGSKGLLRMELWMLKEYSVESWTKLGTIPSPIYPGCRTRRIYPLLFSNKDEIVAMLHSMSGSRCKIVKYYTNGRDVKPETLMTVTDNQHNTYRNAAFIHMESLVWLEEKEQQKE